MRSIISYFALVAIFVWLASEGGFDRPSSDSLPIATSRAPTHLTDLPILDPHELNDIKVVPAAKADGSSSRTEVKVRGVMVNLRAGPGLNYRMIDVAEQGDVMEVSGAAVEGWMPVTDPATGLSAWIHTASVDFSELD
ncbi:MAG: SH3 domain-containing protein [Pseudomonadota bacterium]